MKNGRAYYDHSLTEIEKGNLIEAASGFKPTGDAPEPSSTAFKDTRLREILQVNSSKAVDENGEPLVVYHGSRRGGFDVFDNTKGDGKYKTPEGMAFFARDRLTAYSYSGSYDAPVYVRKEDDAGYTDDRNYQSMYECFLNIRNPYESFFDGVNWDGTAYGKFELFSDETGTVTAPEGSTYWDSWEEAEAYAEEQGLEDYSIEEDPNTGTTTDYEAKYARESGHDGAIIHDVVDGSIYADPDKTDVYVVFSPEQIKSATDNAGTFDPRNPSILFQKAYHGSPYGFDSFSTDAIGSGEGHQAFGWGLYFTDNRGIAEGYAKKLAKPKVRYKGEDTETAKRRAQGTRTEEEREAGEKSAEEFTLGFIERLARNKALGLISDYKENIKKQIEFRENSLEGKGYPLNETEKRIHRKQIEALRNIDPEQIEILSVPRNLYTVDIPDGDYIKWDGPLTEGQKRKITEQARKEGVTDGRGEPFAYEEDGEWRVNTGASSSGEIFYRMELQGYFPDDKAKSLFLARAGIKGIDYPAGSLSDGAEGRNFVVFDATDVQVQSRILFQMEPIDDVQLREAINSVPHTEARRQYIRDIYERRKDSYETREFVSRDGKLKGMLEVYKQRSFFHI